MRGLPLEHDGRTWLEAAPWDLTAFAAGGMLGPLKGKALDAFIEYGKLLLAQRTLAKSDLLALALFCAGLPHLRLAALAGDVEAAREIREGMRGLGLIEPDRIEPFRGDRPALAKVLPFRDGEKQPCGA